MSVSVLAALHRVLDEQREATLVLDAAEEMAGSSSLASDLQAIRSLQMEAAERLAELLRRAGSPTPRRRWAATDLPYTVDDVNDLTRPQEPARTRVLAAIVAETMLHLTKVSRRTAAMTQSAVPELAVELVRFAEECAHLFGTRRHDAGGKHGPS